jgi:FKBP-type peptidyl-prolyl cis-trans isomerase
VLGTESAGRYKKCAVSGKDVAREILVALLPIQVETVVNHREQQEAQITNLSNRITGDSTAARSANVAAATAGNRAYRATYKAQAKLATQDEAAAKASLAKLKADHAAYVKKTKATTTVRMKNTGLVYKGLAVWECQASPKPQ